MVEAIVDFDYTAKEPDELTLHKGDVLRNIIMKPGGWWEGTLNDKRGMFPDNFVHIIEEDNDVIVRNIKHEEKRQCRAIFSYEPVHEDELRLNTGDVIEILGEVEEGWWKGKLNEKVGVFPSNFVKEIFTDSCGTNLTNKKSKMSSKEDLTNIEMDLNAPSLPPKPVKILCQVLYPYKACSDDELTLNIGDIITLISKDGQDKGWWRGELDGHVGVFPDNFVAILTTTDAKLTEQQKLAKKSLQQNNTVQKEPSVRQQISNVALHRKSLDPKSEVPPVPGKKPTIPIKKSPSLSGTGSIFAGLKQKVMGVEPKSSEVTDGICYSTNKTPDSKESNNNDTEKQNEFDRVEHSGMLADPRANRAKAPGRRPPSMILRDSEVGLTNGNLEHQNLKMENIEHQSIKTEIVDSAYKTPEEVDSELKLKQTDWVKQESESEVKPKQRDWEKHRAPWMEELKLNQAKKTSPINLSPNSKLTSPEQNLKASNEKLNSLEDNEMSRSLRLRTPTPDLLVKNKNPTTTTPPRPHTILGDPKSFENVTKISPVSLIRNKSPSPVTKPPICEKSEVFVNIKQFTELEETVKSLQALLEKQEHMYKSKIEELTRKLETEIEMRHLLQQQVNKLEQCITQV